MLPIRAFVFFNCCKIDETKNIDTPPQHMLFFPTRIITYVEEVVRFDFKKKIFIDVLLEFNQWQPRLSIIYL